jgi:hypothetical protein
MSVDWRELSKILTPVKSYEVLIQGLTASFAYDFVRQAFNYSMPDLGEYTRRGLGSDPREAYRDSAARLIAGFEALDSAGIKGVLDLLARLDSRPRLEAFTETTKVEAAGVAGILKYLYYWFVPRKKPLASLMRDDMRMRYAFKVLAGMGIRSSLELLAHGRSKALRKKLAEESHLPLELIQELVNRADLSRMPWASKATISNIIAAGYPSLASLVAAEPQKLYADYYAYGRSIGKNLKLGNEIENCHRIALTLPLILHPD